MQTSPFVACLLFCIAAGVVLTTAGCERRIEEPISPTTERSAQAEAPTVTAVPSGSAARCIRPTPTEPTRVLTDTGPDPRCPKDPTGVPMLRKGKITFEEAKAPDLDVEITDKDEDRARGLMYRKSMPEYHGMLFVFQDRRNHSFWMHNTCIPLDMLFIDTDGTIVGIEENTPTMNDSTFDVGCPSLYVLEVNAGWTRRHGVVAGQKIKIERF